MSGSVCLSAGSRLARWSHPLSAAHEMPQGLCALESGKVFATSRASWCWLELAECVGSSLHESVLLENYGIWFAGWEVIACRWPTIASTDSSKAPLPGFLLTRHLPSISVW